MNISFPPVTAPGGGGGGGDGEKLVLAVSQTGHGFTEGQIVAPSASGFVLARANADETSRAVGMVLNPSTDAFDLFLSGFLAAADAPAGLSANTDYVLSAATAGAYTNTAPTGETEFLTSLFKTTDVGDVVMAIESLRRFISTGLTARFSLLTSRANRATIPSTGGGANSNGSKRHGASGSLFTRALVRLC